jgi:hypothetical protein
LKVGAELPGTGCDDTIWQFSSWVVVDVEVLGTDGCVVDWVLMS